MLSSAVDAEPYVDHNALTVKSVVDDHHSSGSSWWRHVKASSVLKLAGCTLLSFGFLLPVDIAWVGIHRPKDVAVTIAYISLIPVFAAFQEFFPSMIPAPFVVNRAVKSMNVLRKMLPVLLAVALAISGALIGPLHKTAEDIAPSARWPHDPSGATNHSELMRGVVTVHTPYLGAWGGVTDVSDDFSIKAAYGFDTPKMALALPLLDQLLQSSAEANRKSVHTGIPFVFCTPDSGCTGSCTDDCRRLVNKRACDEVFGQANGHLTRCTVMGDMPVIARTREGELVKFDVRNVRCVPDFKYTLLSVTQLWEEQHIDARFRDLNHLEFPPESGNITIPYDVKAKLKTLVFVSEALMSKGQRAAAAGEVNSVKPTDQTALVGFHSPKATAHISKMSAQAVGHLMHNRTHLGDVKIRALAQNTSDAPKNVSIARKVTCVHCAASQIKRTPHSGHLQPPENTPGKLHGDMKGPFPPSIHGYKYAWFLTDEATRKVWVQFLKQKSDVVDATKRVMAEFNATVGTPVLEDGSTGVKPTVRELRSDHEGGLESHHFHAFKGDASLHSTMSPPHDHDLNPIAERTIGVIDTLATSMKSLSGAKGNGFWPYFVRNAVDVHNATDTHVGTSLADSLVSSEQRFSLKRPSVMDLLPIGARTVVLKPPTHQQKGSLTARGWVGELLGRSSTSVGAYDVYVKAINRVVTSSSLMCDEENFPWRGADSYQPIVGSQQTDKEIEIQRSAPNVVPEKNVSAKPQDLNARPTGALHMLNLFSGEYDRTGGLLAILTDMGWSHVTQIDNDAQVGGGWKHDLLNDELYTTILADAKRGKYDSVMIAFPCSTFSIARLFDASDESNDRGPPPVRDDKHPDGLPIDQIDPAHVAELQRANLLLDRSVEIAIAAYRSPRKSTIVFENPADRSVVGTTPYLEEYSMHGSLFATTAMKRLESAIGPLKSCTFAFCRLGSEMQKYTTLVYTPDASTVLDQLSSPKYQCNHPKNSHTKTAGGRKASGGWASSDAAAYPDLVNRTLAMAFTKARTGSTRPVVDQNLQVAPESKSMQPIVVDKRVRGSEVDDGRVAAQSFFEDKYSAAQAAQPPHDGGGALTPVAFRGFGNVRTIDTPGDHLAAPRSAVEGRAPPGPQGRAGRAVRSSVRMRSDNSVEDAEMAQQARGAKRASRAPQELPTVEEDAAEPDDDVLYTTFTGTPITANSALRAVDDEAQYALRAAGAVAEAAVSEIMFDMYMDQRPSLEVYSNIVYDDVHVPQEATRIDKTTYVLAVDNAPTRTEQHRAMAAEVVEVRRAHLALRADSSGAPSSHKQAAKRGHPWPEAELKEMTNHQVNRTWTELESNKLPAGKSLHRFLWIYKMKRDGTAKARLGFDGSTFVQGVDYDQSFSKSLRYGSARALFAFAARKRAKVRSWDLVAAYLQGDLEQGEEAYARMPPGYEKVGKNGEQMICRVDKPCYGMNQSGRRLYRKLMPWLTDPRFHLKQLDDSDECVLVLSDAESKRRGGETLAVGLYVDNLQVVHSAELNDDGTAVDPTSMYAELTSALVAEWDVVDEGPMVDLLGMHVRHNDGGRSITLHQTSYIEKMIKRFYPNGLPADAQDAVLPHSPELIGRVADAVAAAAANGGTAYPELVKPFQEKCGSLMYSSNSCRPDCTQAVHRLCQAMACPTPELMLEIDIVMGYLDKHKHLGITYDADESHLKGQADASWETHKSTSGWCISWQNAVISWGSRRQKCVALSSCEAEIVALSEAAKDFINYCKLVRGIDGAFVQGPSELATDNTAARDLSYNAEHHERTKHIERRHFFVRDMVEKLELRVPHVSTHENCADFFTKPLDKTKFQKFRAIIMNETPVSRASAALISARAADRNRISRR